MSRRKSNAHARRDAAGYSVFWGGAGGPDAFSVSPNTAAPRRQVLYLGDGVTVGGALTCVGPRGCLRMLWPCRRRASWSLSGTLSGLEPLRREDGDAACFAEVPRFPSRRGARPECARRNRRVDLRSELVRAPTPATLLASSGPTPRRVAATSSGDSASMASTLFAHRRRRPRTLPKHAAQFSRVLPDESPPRPIARTETTARNRAGSLDPR